MKLESLKSVELNGVEIPNRVQVPDFANENNLCDRIFGALCRINPELPCMSDAKFLRRVFSCIESANGQSFLPLNWKDKAFDIVTYMKTDATVAKWRDFYAEEKIRKANYRAANKEVIAKQKEELKAKFGTAIVNGVEEPLQSYALEPEGIFFGRGDSPINGYWKFENKPEDLRLNITSKSMPVLIWNKGEEKIFSEFDNWNVQWNPDAHFAAQYLIKIGIPDAEGNIKEEKASKYKMIQFAATSSVKKEGQSKKYAAATELGKAYNKILAQVKKDFEEVPAKNLSTAVAVFMLFEKGIRIGFAGETANGTKGLLALKWDKDVKRVGNKIKFDFYGKDSVRDTSVLETEFADVIEACWSLNERLDTNKFEIKEYIGKLAPAIKDVFSPKLCRTAVAAAVMTKALEDATAKYKLTTESTDALKKLAFNEANMAVAKRLNHQRGVSKAAEAKREAANTEKKAKLEDRAEKVKELNRKRKESIAKIKAAKKEGWKDRVAKLEEMIAKSNEKLQQSKLDLKFKVENGNITGSTSKAAYIDPSIVAEWCSSVNLSLDKIYTKGQIVQFSQFFGEEL